MERLKEDEDKEVTKKKKKAASCPLRNAIESTKKQKKN